MRKNNRPTGNCPCNSGKNYKECCKPYHKGTKKPKTALLLMRARYSAFVKGRDSFILETWHPSTRPEQIEEEDIKWTSLEIQDIEMGEENDETGTITFYVRFIKDGFPSAMTEISQFVKENGEWFYLKGIIK